jgi:hypothetical protein
MKQIKYPETKVRNRGECIFPAESKKVKDKKDHFPFGSEVHGRNALARAEQYTKVPSWFDDSLEELKEIVIKKVHSKYKDIEIAALKKD